MTDAADAPPPPQGPRRGRLLLMVGAALVLVIAAVVGFWLIDNDQHAEDTAASAQGDDTQADVQSDATPVTPTAPAPRPVRRSLGASAQPADGISVQVTSMEPVRGEARGIGEIAGPALRVTVALSNETSRPLDMTLGLVNMYYGPDKAPADALSGPGATPFPQQLRPGSSAEARLVYDVPKDGRDQLTVEFSYAVDQPTVVFRGSADDV